MTQMTDLERELLAALEAEHQALDHISARLIMADPEFRPTKSKHWPAVEQGWAAIQKGRAAADAHRDELRQRVRG